jgi:uroporphyrinogen decarboxylase
MTKKERMKKMIAREEIDYLPSYIEFSDRTRDDEVKKAMGAPDDMSLDDYLENGLNFVFQKQDIPLFWRNDTKWMKELEKEGYCKVDVEGGVVYDSWGMGIKMGEDGFFACFHPLEKKLEKDFAEKWMPERIHAACMADTLEERIKLWTPPDPNQEGNWDFAKQQKKDLDDEYYLMGSGYFGIHERCYGMISITAMFENMLLEPNMIAGLLEKITDYKIGVAENFVKLGVDAGHMGDDLGTQVGPFFGPDQFHQLIAPQYKRLWKVYKDAGYTVGMHSCGAVTEFIPSLIDMGLDILHPVQPCMDHKMLKREYGKDLTFFGGIDTQYLLPNGTPEEVKAGSLEVMENLGAGGGYIVAPSQEIMKDVPLENVVAMLETIIEHRERVSKM